MKNYAKSLALLLVAALLTMCLVACGSKSDNQKDTSKTTATSNVSGKTYAFTSCTADGEDITATMTAMFSEQKLTFKADGTCVQTMVWAGAMAELVGTDPVEISGTYKESGKTVTATFASDEEDTVMEFTVDGDTLTMDDNGNIMVYKKTN